MRFDLEDLRLDPLLGEELFEEDFELLLRRRPAAVFSGPSSTFVVIAKSRSSRRLSCSRRSIFSCAAVMALLVLGEGPLFVSPGVNASSIAIRALVSSW